MKKIFILFIIITGLIISPALAADFTVDFAANVTRGTAPLAVQFYNLAGSTGNCTWLIDGYEINECPGPAHLFTIPGIYDINLTITDELNAVVTETKTAYINVTPPDNRVYFSFIGQGVYGTNPVEITDKTTGKIVFVGNTNSKNVNLTDGEYTATIEPGGITDSANSPDYGLTIAAQMVRKNLLGVFIGGAMALAILGYFWRKS